MADDTVAGTSAAEDAPRDTQPEATAPGDSPDATADATVDATDDATDDVADAPSVDPDSKVVFGYQAPNSTLDPHAGTSGDFLYKLPVYDRLFALNEASEPEPMLATGWTFSDDGSTLTLTLRDDVTFHDGTPFDATAVRANLERGMTVEGSIVAAGLSAIESIEVVDDHTVALHLVPGRGAELPGLFTRSEGMMVSPAALESGVDLSLSPGLAGSGAYVVEEFVPTDKTVYTRAEDYWNADAVEVQTLEIHNIPDLGARANGLQTGAIDIVMATPQEAPTVQTLAGDDITVQQVGGLSSSVIMLRAGKEPLSDVNVRRAMSLAIDRELICEETAGGVCSVDTAQPPAPGHWAYEPDLEPPVYDPEAAKEMLSAAGADGLAIEIIVPNTTQVVTTSTAIEPMLEAAGFDVTMTVMPQADAIAGYRSGQGDALMFGITGVTEPEYTLQEFFFGGYGLAAEPALIESLHEEVLDPTLSLEQRGELYGDIWQVIADQAWYVYVMRSDFVYAFNADVEGVLDAPWLSSGSPDFSYLGVKE